MRSKVKWTLLLTAIFTILISVSVFAKGRCNFWGCSRTTDGCHNGTVYCDVHAAVYAKMKGYKVCSVGGCYDVAASGNRYCSSHICTSRNCDKQSVRRHGYCVEHKCIYPGCELAAYYHEGKYRGYCNTHAWQLSDNNSTSSTVRNNKPSGNNGSTVNGGKPKKEEYDMPDCDDYDSYEDFMDDWDGCMPDGSDAEDYWDNW